MFALNKLKSLVSGTASKFNGRLDALQAVCAMAALVANADNKIEEDEAAKAVEIISTHPTLSAAFDGRKIETVMNEMITRSKSITGKAGLWKEIDDIASDKDMCETVYLTGLDVAMADGSVSPEEQKVIDRCRDRMRIDTKKLGLD